MGGENPKKILLCILEPTNSTNHSKSTVLNDGPKVPVNSNFMFGCAGYSTIHYSVLNHVFSCSHLYCIKAVEIQLKSFFRQPLCETMMSILIKARFPLGSHLTDKLFNNTLLAPKV